MNVLYLIIVSICDLMFIVVYVVLVFLCLVYLILYRDFIVSRFIFFCIVRIMVVR